MNDMKQPQLTCDDLVTYLSAYLDQELDEALSQAARVHLATCRNCRVVLDTTRETIALYRHHGRREMQRARRSALYGRLAAHFAESNNQSK